MDIYEIVNRPRPVLFHILLALLLVGLGYYWGRR